MHDEDHTSLSKCEECVTKIILTSLSKSEECVTKIILTSLSKSEECMMKILLTSLSKSEECMLKIILSCLSMMKIVHVRLSKSEACMTMRTLVFLKSGGDGNGTNLKLVCTIWLGEEYGTWQVGCQLPQSSANTD